MTETETIEQQPNINQQPTKLFYTVKEAAFVLNVSEKTVRRFIVRGLLPRSNVLRKILIPCRKVEQFVDETGKSPRPQFELKIPKFHGYH